MVSHKAKDETEDVTDGNKAEKKKKHKDRDREKERDVISHGIKISEITCKPQTLISQYFQLG